VFRYSQSNGPFAIFYQSTSYEAPYREVLLVPKPSLFISMYPQKSLLVQWEYLLHLRGPEACGSLSEKLIPFSLAHSSPRARAMCN